MPRDSDIVFGDPNTPEQRTSFRHLLHTRFLDRQNFKAYIKKLPTFCKSLKYISNIFFLCFRFLGRDVEASESIAIFPSRSSNFFQDALWTLSLFGLADTSIKVRLARLNNESLTLLHRSVAASLPHKRPHLVHALVHEVPFAFGFRARRQRQQRTRALLRTRGPAAAVLA